MAFDKLTYGRVWTNDADFPTFQNDETQVRADMQYHPDAVKDYINNKLLRTLEAKGAAAELGAVNKIGARVSIQSMLENLAAEIAQLTEDIGTLAGGGVPSVTQSSAVSFSADSWATTDGGATLIIPKDDHKRENANFGYNLYQSVGGIYKSGTWGTAATRVTYNASIGTITLTADEAYSGKIVFFGL